MSGSKTSDIPDLLIFFVTNISGWVNVKTDSIDFKVMQKNKNQRKVDYIALLLFLYETQISYTLENLSILINILSSAR